MSSIKKYLGLIIILIGLVVVAGWILLYGRSTHQLPLQNPSSPIVTTTSSTIVPTQASSTSGIKTYTNTEYGFEFEYPSNLTVRENTFESYYSKFNLEVDVKDENGKYLDVFDVNVVMPIFADRTFLSIEATTSSVVIAGVSGTRYEYVFESLPEIAVVLPLGQYKAILGIGGGAKFYGYANIFNQILVSFKLLK